MVSTNRISSFEALLAEQAELAFIPFGPELTYLAGVQRPVPTYGATIHPGQWLEGLWLAPGRTAHLVLTRMTAEFSPPQTGDLRTSILPDHADPQQHLKSILRQLGASQPMHIAVVDRAPAETLIHLQAQFPGASFLSATQILQPLRMVKSAEEIARMRRAGEITEAAFADVIRQLQIGMSELEVVMEVDYQLRRHGSIGSSFNTTLYAVGPNHELLFGDSQRTWKRRLEPPVYLLFDFGAIYQGYCYDYGRTVCFGEAGADVRQAFELVMAAQQAGIRSLHAGHATASQADQAARAVIEAAGMGETFRHRLGHGIGLDVHEPPFLIAGDDTTLQAGMLFTVEPSVLVPFAGSARVEDVVLVTPEGGLPLTTGFQELVVIN